MKRFTVLLCALISMRAASAPTAAPGMKPFRALKHADAHSLAISRDGSLLASAATTDFPGPGEVRVWRMRDGKLLRVMKHQYGVESIAFSPDSRTLAIASNGTVRLWDVRSWRRIRILHHKGWQLTGLVAFSPDGQTIAGGGSMAETGDCDDAYLWDAQTGRLKRKLQNSNGSTGVGFASNRILAGVVNTGDNEGKGDAVKFWDARSGVLIHRQEHLFAASLAASPDGKTLATGSSHQDAEHRTTGDIRVWDTRSGQMLRTFKHDAGILSLAYSPDGAVRASSDTAGWIRLCDAKTGQLQQQWKVQASESGSLEFAPGKVLVSVGGNTILFWKLR